MEEEIKTTDILQKTIEATNSMKEATNSMKSENDRREKLLNEEKDLLARRMLGGGSLAGQPVKEEEKPKEETPKEYAERVLRGGL